jgi:uncharacterized glyoxalase superfamily protein PhnB
MSDHAPKLYPCLSYRDPDAAIRFLVRGLGFLEHLVVRDEAGAIVHAEVAIGPEIVMLGAARPDLGWVSPLDLAARNATVSLFLPGDIDTIYATALAAGATSVRAPYDTAYGARECSVRDPEQHEWHIGTYRPVVDASPSA